MPRALLSMVLLAACFSVNSASGQSSTPGVLQFLPDDPAGGAFVRPQQILQSAPVQQLIQAADAAPIVDEAMQEATRQLGLDPRQVLEFAVFFPQPPASDSPAAIDQQARLTLKNNLKQVGLAMHNFHDTYKRFPADDGPDRSEAKGNLSWRVWLLPFLGEAELYHQFRQDEPWDSGHNRALLNQMPDVFRTPGVQQAGQTALHVFTGAGAPFHNHKAPSIRDFVDGTSNTLLAVVAGAETAEPWTKPGGLSFDPENPAAALGDVGKQFLTLITDGSVRELSTEVDSQSLLHLIQHQDGMVIPDADSGRQPRQRDLSKWPAFYVRSQAVLNQQQVLDAAFSTSTVAEPMTIGGLTAYDRDGLLVVFPDEHSLLAASEPLLTRVLEGRSESPDTDTELAQDIRASDAYVFGSLDLLQRLAGQDFSRMPLAGLFQNITSVQLSVDISDPEQPFQHAIVRTKSEVFAQQIAALMQGGIQIQKAQILGASVADGSPLSPELAQQLAAQYDRIKVTTDGPQMTYRLDKPENLPQLISELGPLAKPLFERVRIQLQQAAQARKKNALKQIGLAFHNYHDVHTQFPYPGRSPYGDPNVKRGLSWRVQLLPYLSESRLYEKFRLDEPWDSEHNKPLIAEMPDVYKVAGITAEGQTSIHVFVGPGTPFDGDRAPRIRNFTDGTSNTILAVQAGPDTAVPWTKPGGLEVNPEDPQAALGDIQDEFLILMADGYVGIVSAMIDAVTLSRLIQPGDGNVVDKSLID